MTAATHVKLAAVIWVTVVHVQAIPWFAALNFLHFLAVWRERQAY
jgi:hypothetical protein